MQFKIATLLILCYGGVDDDDDVTEYQFTVVSLEI